MSRYDGQIARMHCVIAVDPVYVCMACQKSAVTMRVMTANFANVKPKLDLATIGKGMCKCAPEVVSSACLCIYVLLPQTYGAVHNKWDRRDGEP